MNKDKIKVRKFTLVGGSRTKEKRGKKGRHQSRSKTPKLIVVVYLLRVEWDLM